MNDDTYFVEGDFSLIKRIDCEKAIHCCKFDPKGEIFAVGLTDGSIKIYNKECQLLYTLIDDETKRSNLPATGIKFNNPKNDKNPDHYKILVVTYVSGFVKFWYYPSKSCIYTIRDINTITDTETHPFNPLNIDFNADFDRIAICGYSKNINIYDVPTKKLVNVLQSSGDYTVMDGHVSRVFCVKYNPLIPNQLFSGGWDKTVQIWDDRLPNSQTHLSGPKVCGEAIDIDIKNNHLLTGSCSKESSLQIWDLRTKDLIRDVFEKNSNMKINACQWLGDEYILVGGFERNAALVYDRGTLKSLGGITDLKHSVVCLDNNHDGRVPDLIIGSDKYIYYIRKKPDFRSKK